ncbi:MAG: hypothetical protein QM500_16825 [Methylococcales bacterium]
MPTHANEKYFTVLVTRDCTESATIPVLAKDEDLAAELAVSSEICSEQFNHLFQANENFSSKAYLGAGADDVQEINKETFRRLIVSADKNTLPDKLTGDDDLNDIVHEISDIIESRVNIKLDRSNMNDHLSTLFLGLDIL